MEVKWMAVLVDFFNKGYGLPLLGLAAACSVIFGLIILWNGEATEVATQTENSSAEGSGSRDSTGVEAPRAEKWPVIAESTNDYDVELLESRLCEAAVSAHAETQNRNSVRGATQLSQNRLRVKPDSVEAARKILRESNFERFLTDV